MRHNAFMLRIVAPAFLAAMLLMAGCQQPTVVMGGKDRPAEETFDTVITLSPSAAEIISAKMNNQVLFGRPDNVSWPQSVLNVEVVADADGIDWERIKELNADLLVYEVSEVGPARAAEIEAQGIPTMKLEAKTFEDLADFVERLGSKLASETRAADYVDDLYKARANALAAPISPAPKVACVELVAAGRYKVHGPDTFLADIVRIAGGELIGPAGGGELDEAGVKALGADLIVASGGAEALSGGGQAVARVDASVAFRPGARVHDAISNLNAVFARIAAQ